jgi:hypothetical protein
MNDESPEVAAINPRMPNARAIRKDHNPFVFFGLLKFVRWPDHCCPHCNEVYRRTYFPDSVIFGDGRRTCAACGMIFDDESREWPELRTGQKLRFLMPPPILGLFGGVLLSGVLALALARGQVAWIAFAAGVLLVVSTLPALAWTAIHLPAIRRSIESCKLAHHL